MSLLADIYLKTNDWANATHAADIVLEKGKSHNKARLVKAEALFNVCQFEHAMVHFHRGMVSTKTDTVTKNYRNFWLKSKLIGTSEYACLIKVPKRPTILYHRLSDFLFFRQHPEIGNKNRLFDWVFKNAKKSYMIVFHRNQKFLKGMEWRFCSKCLGLSMKAGMSAKLIRKPIKLKEGESFVLTNPTWTGGVGHFSPPPHLCNDHLLYSEACTSKLLENYFSCMFLNPNNPNNFFQFEFESF